MTDTCTVTSQTTEATATANGSAVYTAVLTIGENSYSDTFTVTLPATGSGTSDGTGSNVSGNAGSAVTGSAGGNTAGSTGSGSGTPGTGDTSAPVFASLRMLAVSGAVIIRIRKHRA